MGLRGGRHLDLEKFKPDGIAAFRPKSHHTMVPAAKQLAIEMLRDIHERAMTPAFAGAAPASCNVCQHEFVADLPAALMVLVPKDPELGLVGGCLCGRCLTCEDVLEVVVAAFGRVVSGARLEAVQ
jgi:hypothetical protein